MIDRTVFCAPWEGRLIAGRDISRQRFITLLGDPLGGPDSRNTVHSPTSTVARRTFVAQLALTLSLVSACGSDVPVPTEPGGPPPTPSAVDVAYCRGAEPAWAAFQDGDGPWTRALPISAGAYTKFPSRLLV